MRRRSDSFDISREKTATTWPPRMAAFCAMLMASAVLPIEGRAAMMTSSEFCSPLVMRSNFVEVGGEAGDLAPLLIEVVDGFEGAGDDLGECWRSRG